MTTEIKSWLLVSILMIFLISASHIAEADDDLTSLKEESKITVSIVGNSIIDLDSDNKLLRAYVDIVNHDPSNGYYFLRVIQSATDKIISEAEIIIREKSNDKAGADIAHMFNEEEISINGTAVLGDYEIEVFSENGNAIGTTTFSIIKSSEFSAIQISEITEDIDNISETESVDESVENESQLENTQEIPDWVKNIFILYADGSITENELISALKFLIEQGIIEIN
ncbi:MAG: hypothetical protein WD018_04020 [Nitrosopumilaceae archaeon]